MTSNVAALLLTACFFAPADSAAPADEASPYGICAHVSRHGDHELAAEEFKLMRQAGIRWARTDFDWTTVQSNQDGPWDFSMFDETVDLAGKTGVKILPILAYDVPWASPAYEHMDQWLEYVRKTVTRYRDRLRCWEIWNEPDLEQFWRGTPDPAQYAAFLKATYREIKRIDPSLTVLLGGVSGIPYEYIEGVYKAGGGDAFDVMAVHPYRYPETPEARSLREDLARLRTLMAQYGDANKPVWITEIGWPTHESGGFLLDDLIRTGLGTADPGRTDWTLAVFDDPAYPVQTNFSDSRLRSLLPGTGRVERLAIDHMNRLSPATHHALLMPPDEGFAADCFDAIESYVRDGGIVIFTQGVPLYYTVRRADDGSWQRQNADDSYRRRFRIGWEAWWTRQGVPKEAAALSAAEPFASQIRLSEHAGPADRFLTDAQLKPGDRFIPLLQARQGDYTGSPAAVFDLNSDMKGAVIVSTLRQDFRGISEDRQAAILPRAYLIALHSGVDRVFWYNLRARENNPYYNEDHFGIVHKDLSPKPAYRAMQALNRARPAGSEPLDTQWQTGDIFHPAWKRPDGQTVFALWTAGTGGPTLLRIEGPIKEAFNHLGEPISLPTKTCLLSVPLSAAPLYLVGPEQIKLDSPAP